METNNQKNDQNIIPNDADKQQKGVNVPNLRFNNESWTESKMGNVCSKFDYGIGAEAIDFDGKNRYIRITDIDEENSHYIRKSEVSPSFIEENCIVKENDILFARTGASTGKTYLYNEQDGKLYFAGFLIRANVRNEFSAYFIYQQTKINRYKKWIQIMSARSGQPGINAKEYQEYKVYYPNRQIQDKMASFFTLLDQRIDTQSKIIEDLELFKKGIRNYIYLTKSSDWKCVKLSDILCERKDFALKGDEFIHATLSKDGIFAKTDRYDRDFLVTNDEKEYKITRLNDICYNPANLKFGVICLNKFGDAIFSPIYVTYIVKNDFIPSFVELILTSSRFLKYIRKYEQGTVYERMAVNSEDFLKGEILIPTKDKQKAIADYFDMLDLKIKKEKDILELYKKQKAYLLKNMFI